MIHDQNIWLLRPGARRRHFGKLVKWLDDSDPRPAAEQLGLRWQPLERGCRLEDSALYADGQRHEAIGAIRLHHELILLFENGFIAIKRGPEGPIDVVRLEMKNSRLRATA